MNFLFKSRLSTAMIILLVVVLGINCKNVNRIPRGQYLEVFYVPFSMSTEGQLFESEVRDLSIPYVSHFCTSKSGIMNQLRAFAYDPSLQKEDIIKDIAPYMVIDIHTKSNSIEKVIIGPSIFFKRKGKVYLMSREFKEWVDSTFPKATFPVGSRQTCSGKVH